MEGTGEVIHVGATATYKGGVKPKLGDRVFCNGASLNTHSSRIALRGRDLPRGTPDHGREMAKKKGAKARSHAKKVIQCVRNPPEMETASRSKQPCP